MRLESIMKEMDALSEEAMVSSEKRKNEIADELIELAKLGRKELDRKFLGVHVHRDIFERSALEMMIVHSLNIKGLSIKKTCL